MNLRKCSSMLWPAFFLVLGGCATAVRGYRQEVPISSNPPGAEVLVDGEYVGTTPTTSLLSRKSPHSVRIQKQGYVAYETSTGSKENPESYVLLLPAAIFPPLIFVDMFLGGVYDVEPDEISVQLLAGPATSAANDTSAP
jgi:hypothetical protein